MVLLISLWLKESNAPCSLILPLYGIIFVLLPLYNLQLASFLLTEKLSHVLIPAYPGILIEFLGSSLDFHDP